MPIDTAKVTGFRMLRFNSPMEMHADIARLVEADQARRLRQLGNWTLGQNLGHLAAWASYPFEGYPISPPFFIRWIMKGRKRKYLQEGLPRGVRIPRVEGGTLAVEVLSTDEGFNRINAAWARLEKNCPMVPNPIFGPLTHEEWIQMHLRHAELHLSFLKVE
jgi:hypothetical protein